MFTITAYVVIGYRDEEDHWDKVYLGTFLDEESAEKFCESVPNEDFPELDYEKTSFSLA